MTMITALNRELLEQDPGKVQEITGALERLAKGGGDTLRQCVANPGNAKWRCIMSFYQFSLGGDKPEKDADNLSQGEAEAEAERINAAVQEIVKRAKVMMIEVSETLGDNRAKILAVQFAAVAMFDSMIHATLRHPEPGRTALAKMLYPVIGHGDDCILNKIGALAYLTGEAVQGEDGSVELRPKGDDE